MYNCKLKMYACKITTYLLQKVHQFRLWFNLFKTVSFLKMYKKKTKVHITQKA